MKELYARQKRKNNQKRSLLLQYVTHIRIVTSNLGDIYIVLKICTLASTSSHLEEFITDSICRQYSQRIYLFTIYTAEIFVLKKAFHHFHIHA